MDLGGSEGGFWVFGYGSLIWQPGFDFVDKRRATLTGYQRAFCMTSIVYRGTPENPGLVLALDQRDGHSCTGVAYRVPPKGATETLAYLRARELVSDAYNEARVSLSLDDGRLVEALAYVSNPAHAQYCGGLSLQSQAEVIAHAVGPRGPNADYLLNTVESLDALGLHDPDLVVLAEMVCRLRPREGSAIGRACPPT